MFRRMTVRRGSVLLALLLFGSLVLVLRPGLPEAAAAGNLMPAGVAQAAGTGGDDRVQAAAVRLEALHRRTAARLQSDDDDRSVVAPPALAGRPVATQISPEQAAQLAIRASGDGQVRRVELTRQHGRPVYAVQVGQTTVYLDAATGAVLVSVPADSQE